MDRQPSSVGDDPVMASARTASGTDRRGGRDGSAIVSATGM
jgi:hypothetical protein